MPQWTQEQLDAITDRGHSLIVCAAAGSGKTAVLVERIVRLVIEGCPVEDMLVVTFTNAAAGEMRLRIGEALSRAARENPALGEQVLALSRASISTLHRFCGNLLRENFQALGLDPAFRIGDEQECGVMSRQAMEDALYSCYEVGSADFLAADACYTQEELTELARSLYVFMMTRPDPWAWLDNAVAACGADADALGESEAAAVLTLDALAALSRLLKQAQETLALCRGKDGPLYYAAACEQDVSLLDSLLDAAGRGYAPLRAALADASFAALGRKKKGDTGNAAVAEAVKARRDALKKAVRELADRFAHSLEEAAQDLELTRAPLAGLAELVRTYDALYRAAKRRRGVLDFDDLEHGALQALALPEVRAALRARYRYVFVDEYQDSSAIQEAILGCFAPEDGQFLVGDVKQSIYRFRQAEPGLFLEKAARFDREDEPLMRRIDLQRNFRSRANVLAGVNAVFSRIMRREATEIEYDEREALIPGLPVREDDPPLELHLLYRESTEDGDGAQEADAQDNPGDARELAAVEREAKVAAQRIRALVGTPFYDVKRGEERPLAWRDMAVLLRVARGSAALAAEVLAQEGIPVFCDAGEGYFDMPEIRAMMALLSAIDNGAQNEALLAALRGPALGLTDAELAQIRMATPDVRVPYHEAVRRYRQTMDDALAARLNAFEERLARWRLCARHQGVDRLVERICAETGFAAQAGALPGGAARQANLHLLASRARTFVHTQGGSLHAFLAYAARLRAGGDAMSASAIGESEDVVRIMTTHKSKGLEFPVVIVLGMGRRLGGQSARARLLLHARLGATLPCVDVDLGSERETLLRRAIRIQTEREQLAEEVRILYVAMTRARERLILIGDVGRDAPPDAWRAGMDAGSLLAMRTELDMVAPVLAQAGAALTIPEEEVRADGSVWRVFAHRAAGTQGERRRTDERVAALLADLESAPAQDDELARLLAFEPGQGARAVRKTSVSAVLRDEKRAREEAAAQTAGEDGTQAVPGERTELVRLPRFMQEQRMTGAQIGTAFHRVMRMLDLDALRASGDLAGEVSRQLEQMAASGVLTAAEARAVPARMVTALLASPLGVRMLAGDALHREWAFTYDRTAADGTRQLVQGMIDCCFIERGAWVLVDYKTDSPGDVPGVLARHRPQLALYAEALEAITGMPVRERVLYLVRAGAGYPV